MNKNQLRYAEWLARVLLRVNNYATEGPVFTYIPLKTGITISGTSLVKRAGTGQPRSIGFPQHFPSIQQLRDYLPLFGFTIYDPREDKRYLIQYNDVSVGLLCPH